MSNGAVVIILIGLMVFGGKCYKQSLKIKSLESKNAQMKACQ